MHSTKILNPALRSMTSLYNYMRHILIVINYILYTQTDAEYNELHRSYEKADHELISKFPIYEAPANLTYPDSLDWRTKGAVGSIKDQVHVYIWLFGMSCIGEYIATYVHLELLYLWFVTPAFIIITRTSPGIYIHAPTYYLCCVYIIMQIVSCMSA